MDQMDPKKPGRTDPVGGPPPAPPRSGNIVAEIVDQITEKQARSASRTEPVASGAEACAFCVEAAAEPGTPYRLVLKCASDETPVP